MLYGVQWTPHGSLRVTLKSGYWTLPTEYGILGYWTPGIWILWHCLHGNYPFSELTNFLKSGYWDIWPPGAGPSFFTQDWFRWTEIWTDGYVWMLVWMLNQSDKTPNAIALDLLTSSDWNNDAKIGTPYSMRNYIALLVRKIQGVWPIPCIPNDLICPRVLQLNWGKRCTCCRCGCFHWYTWYTQVFQFLHQVQVTKLINGVGWLLWGAWSRGSIVPSILYRLEGVWEGRNMLPLSHAQPSWR